MQLQRDTATVPQKSNFLTDEVVFRASLNYEASNNFYRDTLQRNILLQGLLYLTLAFLGILVTARTYLVITTQY